MSDPRLMSEEQWAEAVWAIATVFPITAKQITDHITALTEQLAEAQVESLADFDGLKADYNTVADREEKALAELTAERAATAVLWDHVRAAIDTNNHPEDCASEHDPCAKCGLEFDEHPVALRGGTCQEFQLRPCDCWLKDILALLPASGDLAGAIADVVTEHRKIRHNPLDRDKDSLLDLSCALDRLAAEFGGQR